ncbi:hypothetical protein HPB50_014449 [Hyalomma asiaticum]|uniref:Uncharacterized protein n=1 Tax=Hyalomma asiaticum TaxID=266040 RepID=A0ACB7T2J9_HYAAI|nr:hypothetical protein HPB50_014449 [Hyalomma asiaticum]
MVDENDGLEFELEEMGGSGNETSSKPLPVSDLQDYVQRMLACDGLKSEFINQPRGRQYPTIEAQRTENKIKNRYGNLLAYDHSRVKLRPIPGVPFSDYINASYIDGYCRPKRYIATQGPKPHTVDDFWRMVWQENVCKIVMLTGLVENGKTKCEKYWPEKTASYGDVQVHFIAEETFPEYCIHQLHITMADNTREVKHFHLTSWPDHGVPLYPNTLLTFRRKVNHAGVGRTGAYILLENLIEQAQSEGVVDVIGQLSTMRQNRMNVVETLEQYNFVHRALMESVCIRDHSIPCSRFSDRYRELTSVDETTGKSNLVKEFEGFHKKDRFLVTQTPSTRDLEHFWKLVIESGTRTIVTLDVFSDDADVVQFWPTSGTARYGDHKIECTEDRNVNDMSVQTFKVTSKHKGPGSSGVVTIRHFHRTTWNSVEQMVDLVDHVERWQQQSDNKIILVQCRNGCAASGLFCNCFLVLDKLKCEQEVDVFYATRIVRENRPQFILYSTKKRRISRNPLKSQTQGGLLSRGGYSQGGQSCLAEEVGAPYTPMTSLGALSPRQQPNSQQVLAEHEDRETAIEGEPCGPSDIAFMRSNASTSLRAASKKEISQVPSSVTGVSVEHPHSGDGVQPALVALAAMASACLAISALTMLSRLLSPAQRPQRGTCLTRACVALNDMLVAASNASVDPCDNFYEHVCGWLDGVDIRVREAPQQLRRQGTTAQSSLHCRQEAKVIDVLVRASLNDQVWSPTKQAATLLQSCLAIVQDGRDETEAFKGTLSELGVAWPRAYDKREDLTVQAAKVFEAFGMSPLLSIRRSRNLAGM